MDFDPALLRDAIDVGLEFAKAPRLSAAAPRPPVHLVALCGRYSSRSR